MDGVFTSSFGYHVISSSLLSAVPAPAQVPSEKFLSLHNDRQAADIHISQAGDAFSRKVQEQTDRLSQIDPKLAEQYHAVINLLNRTNPRAARHFLDFMDSVLHGVDSTETEPAPVQQLVPEDLRIDSSISVQISALVVQVRGDNVTIAQSEVEVSVSARHDARTQKKVDPLVLDIAGDGVETSGVENGIDFDLGAARRITRSSFVQGDDVVLALDRNGNGVIDDGSELFGVQHGAANGFEELKKFDDNHDGIVDEQDTVFSRLRAVRRQSSNFEVVSLAQLEVQGIFTAYRNQSQTLRSGDEILQHGAFRRSNGGWGIAADIGFSLRI
jgi:hypothetical protein